MGMEVPLLPISLLMTYYLPRTTYYLPLTAHSLLLQDGIHWHETVPGWLLLCLRPWHEGDPPRSVCETNFQERLSHSAAYYV